MKDTHGSDCIFTHGWMEKAEDMYNAHYILNEMEVPLTRNRLPVSLLLFSSHLKEITGCAAVVLLPIGRVELQYL